MYLDKDQKSKMLTLLKKERIDIHITVKKSLLLPYLATVERALPPRASSLTPSGFYLEAKDDLLNLTASGIDMTIQALAAEADVWEGGDIALPIDFSKVIRSLSDDIIEIKTSDKFHAHIKSGETEFNLCGINPELFPKPLNTNLDKHIIIPAQDFKNLITSTIGVTATKSSIPILTGVLLEGNDNNIHGIATDSFRVAYYNIPLQTNCDFRALIPTRTLQEISRIIGDEGNVECYVNEYQAKFIYEQFIITTAMLLGDYPNILPLFKTEPTTTIKINTDELRDATFRATLIGRIAKFEITEDKLQVSTESESGSMQEAIPVTTTGKEQNLNINPELLLGVLKPLQNPITTIEFVDSQKPCFIKCENYKALVLPIFKGRAEE